MKNTILAQLPCFDATVITLTQAETITSSLQKLNGPSMFSYPIEQACIFSFPHPHRITSTLFSHKGYPKTLKTRLIVAKQISTSDNIGLSNLKLLLQDKHFLIRNLALTHFDKLTQTEIDKLLTDKSARVRIQTLYKLKDRNEFTEIIYPFLFDNSASVREFARYSLKNTISDFAKIYNDNLLIKANIIGSLSGLGETNGKDYSSNIEKFLNDKKIK